MLTLTHFRLAAGHFGLELDYILLGMLALPAPTSTEVGCRRSAGLSKSCLNVLVLSSE